MAISEDDLRGLSAVEREALESTPDDDEDLVRELGLQGADLKAADTAANTAAAAGVDEPDDDDRAAAAPAATPAPAAAPVASAPAPAADAPAAATPAVDDEPIEPPAPTRLTPADIDEQRKTLRAGVAESMQKLLDGEITQADHQAVADAAQDKLDALTRSQAVDEAREQINRDAMMADYGKDLRESHKLLAAAGLDPKSDATSKEFDRAVRMFAQDALDRGLTDKPGNLAASKAALEDAVHHVLRRAGKSVPAPAPAPAAAAPVAQTPAAPKRAPQPVDRSQFPPTLANVPVASDPTITNEFAHLEGLEGSSLERQLARLTPEQQERYLG